MRCALANNNGQFPWPQTIAGAFAGKHRFRDNGSICNRNAGDYGLGMLIAGNSFLLEQFFLPLAIEHVDARGGVHHLLEAPRINGHRGVIRPRQKLG